MADQIEVYDVTVAASVPPAAPTVITTYKGGLYTVTGVWVIIPDGHAGLTGIALGYGSTPVIPRNPGAYISGNDEFFRLGLEYYPPGVPWQAFVCNNDLQPHVWELRFELDLITTAVPSVSPNPIPPSEIYAAATATTGGP